MRVRLALGMRRCSRRSSAFEKQAGAATRIYPSSAGYKRLVMSRASSYYSKSIRGGRRAVAIRALADVAGALFFKCKYYIAPQRHHLRNVVARGLLKDLRLPVAARPQVPVTGRCRTLKVSDRRHFHDILAGDSRRIRSTRSRPNRRPDATPCAPTARFQAGGKDSHVRQCRLGDIAATIAHYRLPARAACAVA